MENNCSLVWITPEAEKMMGYIARVSNPANQDNPEVSGLLKYCIKHNHWSVFEQANICIEINTSRAISAQILRHRSFSFQEFSQRYAKNTNYVQYEARRQDNKNRQNSIDDLSEETKILFNNYQESVWNNTHAFYEKMLSLGVAKECARMLLPMNTSTKIYMNGTVRSWIHYINLRTANGTQLEHMKIAEECKDIFKSNLPIISEALEWN